MLQARIRDTKGDKARISTFHYRNVAPLYVGEPMKLCGRESLSKENEVELWVENAEGVQAVRGTAVLRS
jgi:hydroxyacyl-ACP dehydratase HTD2-like protein with hotdog domain